MQTITTIVDVRNPRPKIRRPHPQLVLPFLLLTKAFPSISPIVQRYHFVHRNTFFIVSVPLLSLPLCHLQSPLTTGNLVTILLAQVLTLGMWALLGDGGRVAFLKNGIKMLL